MSEEEYKNVFQNLPLAMKISCPEQGTIIDVNESFIRLVGYSKSEIIGQTSLDLKLWNKNEDRIRIIQQLKQHQTIKNQELQWRTKSNQLIDVELFGKQINLGGKTQLLLIASDISQRKQAEIEREMRKMHLQFQQVVMMELFQSPKVYHGSLQTALQTITQVAAHTLNINRVGIWFYNQERSKIICENLYEMLLFQHSQGQEFNISEHSIYFKAIENEQLIAVENTHTDPTTQEFYHSYLLPLGITSILDVPIFSGGQIVGILCLEHIGAPRTWQLEEQNFTAYLAQVISLALETRDRAQVETALRESEERFRQLAENIESIFWMIDPQQQKTIYVSPAYEKVWGRSRQELYHQPLFYLAEAIHPEDRERAVIQMTKHFQSHQDLEYRIVRPNGEIRWIRDRSFPIRNEAGEIYHVAGIAEDITERKQAEEQMQASLKEKEVLLREIHHRVKNNLYIISNLLDLQSDVIQDKRLLALFSDSQTRIQSMALIHEQLYQSTDLGQVNFGDYIHRLVENLFFSLSHTKGLIKSIVNVEPIQINLETAIPCGLLINELITNSLKHAFPNGRSGEVYVEFYQDLDQKLHLEVRDNGVGISPDIDWDNLTSLGLKLVQILSKQLRATLNLNLSQGSSIELIFAELNYKSRF